jgi:hypothetical protein
MNNWGVEIVERPDLKKIKCQRRKDNTIPAIFCRSIFFPSSENIQTQKNEKKLQLSGRNKKDKERRMRRQKPSGRLLFPLSDQLLMLPFFCISAVWNKLMALSFRWVIFWTKVCWTG